VIYLARQGQKCLFLSHFLLLHCGEDGVSVRGDLAFVAGYRAPSVMERPLLVHGEGERGVSPVAGYFSLSISPTPSPSSSS
jgi:hypothetical protein